jgi:ADP-ribosylglycohydrolase
MNHQERMSAALRSLEGLSVGDAFGECFFALAANPLSLDLHLSTRTLPNMRWRWTDDTAMAITIVEILHRFQKIDQDELAAAFARRYAEDDRRGYGGTAHGILISIGAGEPWSIVSAQALGGMGSMGNGGAMRVAPLGAYFSDNTAELVRQASDSAAVTHAHAEGQAGAVAVALAAAFARNHPSLSAQEAGPALFDFVLQHTPDSQTRAIIAQARDLPHTFSITTAASVLGAGFRLTAPDTVPFCLWSAARSYGDFEEAMWSTIAAGGDMDTNCAIVGGIVSLTDPKGSPPPEWVSRREKLPTFISQTEK